LSTTASQPRNRTRATIAIGAAILAVLVILFFIFASLYTEVLWFEQLGFQEVLFTGWIAGGVMFLIGFAAMAVPVWLSLQIAFRFRPVYAKLNAQLDRYQQVVEPLRRLAMFGIPAVLGIFAGVSASTRWQTALQFLNSTSFGERDPQFGLDVSFYVFQLPFYRWLLSWLFVAIAVSFVAALIAHYLFGGIRLAGRNGAVAPAARAHLAVLVGTFVLFKAVAYFFDRYELLFSDRKAAESGANFFGASYTDLNAAMPAKLILLIIALICAAAFFSAVVLRNLQIPAIALALLVLSSVLVGAAWPAVLEQFSVRPNAIDREADSISRNIAATRQAFGLNNVGVIPYAPQVASAAGTAAVPPQDVANSQATLNNIRIQDPSRLNRTFAVQQQLTNFYAFSPQLDIDRYTVNDQRQDFVLAAREINPDALIGNQQDWINRHLVYTHGQGIVSAPADRVNVPSNAEASQGGLPQFEVSDSSNPGPFGISPDGARIYYGEFLGGADDYAIVGGNPGLAPREFDGPGRPASAYTGPGGVSLGNWAQRLVFAAAYGERNILFNGSIGSESRIIYNRTPLERVEKVAPWLRTDVDPYPAVVDGRLQWIVDGYTTLPRYPYAQQVDIGQATADSLRPATPAGSAGYMRNSVKATVDAYSGEVKLYQMDEQDPVLKTWMGVFPDVVRPSSEITPSLRAHFRYPEDIFKVQRELLTRYHVENPRDFFSTQNFWTIPEDPTRESNASIPPYYLLAGDPRPGAIPDTQFQMTSTLLALSRPNLSAYLSVSSEPETYGQMTVLELPAQLTGDQRGPQGPQQVQAELLTSNSVNQGLFPLRQSGTPVQVQYGNLLTLPVAGGLLYVEPIYVERNAQTSFPQLFGVIARFNNGDIGYAPTLQGALQAAFQGVPLPPGLTVPGLGPTPAQPTQPTPGANTGSGPLPSGVPGQTLSPELSEAVTGMNDALDRLAQAQAARDYRGIGDAEAALDAAIQRFRNTTGAATTPAGG
jgi:uncharacterized protein